jgi:hypothetical protein
MNVKTVLVAVFAVWPCISTANQAHQILQGMSGPKRNEAMTSFMARSGASIKASTQEATHSGTWPAQTRSPSAS